MSDITYTYDEAFAASVKYFGGDELAASAFVKKYALSNNNIYYEKTPEDMHRRLAKEFARIETKYPNALSETEIFSYLDKFKYIVPQGSPMSGIGNPFKTVSLSNCYTLPSPFDSYGGIIYTDQEAAQIYKRRGGVGFDISTIRPKGVATNNAAKTTDGIAVFMERYSRTCREVAMQGRRGALLLSIDVRHPEVTTFINIKQDVTKITGANISVKLSDEFMQAVKDNEDFEHQWPIEEPVIKCKVKARDIWKQIIHNSWASAEPGLLFWDTAKNNTPSDIYKDEGFESISTNPCSEIVLSAYDSCRLMAVNLYSFVENKFEETAYFDFDKFKTTVRVAQRLMDDLVDLDIECIDKILSKVESDPEPDYIKSLELNLWRNIKDVCVKGRRSGLGITALGDTLAALHIRYGDKESIELTEKIYKFLGVSSYAESINLAKERGPFPVFNFEKEKKHTFVSRLIKGVKELFGNELYNDYKVYGRRNIANTTTAPTGTVSVLTQTTSGIEPVFLVRYDRYKKVNPDDPEATVDRVDAVGDAWQKYVVMHHPFKTWMKVSGKVDIEQSPYYRATSNDIDWLASVDIQAAAQKWICHSISKTANLPEDASEDLVGEIYMRAWEKGCKGFTVYRDKCRDGVMVQSDESKELDRKIPARPKSLKSETHKIRLDTGDEIRNAYITVSFFPNTSDPYEVFINTPVDNNLKDLQILELSARMTSLALRHGVNVKFIVDQLIKIDGQYVYSIPNSLAKALQFYAPIEDPLDPIEDPLNDHSLNKDKTGSKCPQCGAYAFIQKEACGSCLECDYSKCG